MTWLVRTNSVRRMRLLSFSPRLIILLSVIFAPTPVGAAQVDDLYEAEVQVASKEDSERNLTLGAALRGVLVKVTGERNPSLIRAWFRR